MITTKEKGNCSGCTACQSICAHRAITMKPDALGFLYPVVDANLCMECHRCEEVCPLLHKEEGRHVPTRVLAARHCVPSEIDRSRSGASFWALAQAFIGNGSIYGVCFDNPQHIVHRRATTLEECQAFRGSKYSQSDLRGIFAQVKQDLSKGCRVLFVGTPCQVAGLKRVISVASAHFLTTVDLICHGCASPRVWEENIRHIEQCAGSKVIEANFRDKRYGWRKCIETYRLEDGRETQSTLFSQLFNMELTERDSCGQCPYTNLKRCGDLTIGDFWSWNKYSNEWRDERGISLILVNTSQGQALLEQAKDYLTCRESNPQQCLQPQLEHPLRFSAARQRFVHDFVNSGYEVALSHQSLTGPKALLRAIRVTTVGKIVEFKHFLSNALKH